jgi:NAD-dependent oxidoreductase involved in siderophore biosynthesis
MHVKRWVAYRRQNGRDTRPLFVVEAISEREALCLASDLVLQLEVEEGGGSGAWTGPMVHVRLLDEVPEPDLAHLVRRVAAAN